MKRNAIINAVRLAGIMDSGDGGEPTYRKLLAKADTVIANGSESEPLLATDTVLMEERPDLVMDGLKLAMTATGAREGIIATRGAQPKLLESLNQALPSDGSISLFPLRDHHPTGDEVHLTYDIKKRVVPEGGSPRDIGIVVNDVVSLAQMARAMGGKAVTEKLVSIVGEVAEPKIVRVPIGTTYSDLLDMAGGTTQHPVAILDGGPLRGGLVQNHSLGITKTTNGITVLAQDHCIIRIKSKSTTQMLKQSKAACSQCMRCTDMCPRYLAGHDIFPHQMMRAINYNKVDTEHLMSSFLCSQCGVCDLIACDVMQLSPRQLFAETRNELEQRGLHYPKTQEEPKVRSGYENARVSLPMLLKKMDIQRYLQKLPYEGTKHVGLVRVPLEKRFGVPVIPQVRVGERVRMGDRIAESPLDQLGLCFHASIAGHVSDICDAWIEIRTRR